MFPGSGKVDCLCMRISREKDVFKACIKFRDMI